MKAWGTGSYLANGYMANSSFGGSASIYLTQNTSIRIDQIFVNGTEYSTGFNINIWKNYK